MNGGEVVEVVDVVDGVVVDRVGLQLILILGTVTLTGTRDFSHVFLGTLMQWGFRTILGTSFDSLRHSCKA